MGALSARMPMHRLHAWYPPRPEEGVGFSGIPVTDGCELPCSLKLNLGTLKEQVLLTFMVPEGAVKIDREEQVAMILTSCELHELQDQQDTGHWQ